MNISNLVYNQNKDYYFSHYNANYYQCFNQDVLSGIKNLDDNSVDLIITDPPYGIDGDKLHRHYNRKEDFVLDGYVEVPQEQYQDFTDSWIAESIRVLREGGSMYIVSGYTNLVHILNALQNSDEMIERNHIIWKYNFGVYATKKYVSSHYHILYYTKGAKNVTFNTDCRYTLEDRTPRGRSLRYRDMEDVWIINREYNKERIKNKNQLPKALLEKMIKYSSNKNDTVLDLFAGSFSTMKTSLMLERNAIGFELNENAYRHAITTLSNLSALANINTHASVSSDIGDMCDIEHAKHQPISLDSIEPIESIDDIYTL